MTVRSTIYHASTHQPPQTPQHLLPHGIVAATQCAQQHRQHLAQVGHGAQAQAREDSTQRLRTAGG